MINVGFIGAGRIGEAMIASLLRSRWVEPQNIFASDARPEQRRRIKKRYGINVQSKNLNIPPMAQTVFLCVKPHQLDEVLKEIAPEVTEDHLMISIAAGKRIAGVQAVLPKARVIRVMPNLPCIVEEGMSAFAAGPTVNVTDRKIATRILSCFGAVEEMTEEHLDAVTALSGSGPAFFAYVLDGFAQASMKEGLSRWDARALALQTMLGTVRLLIEKKMDPKELITAVATPGGTTEAGLKVLDKAGVLKTLQQTIHAAARRSSELSKAHE